SIHWKKRTWEASGKTYSHHYPILEANGLPKLSRFEPAALTTARSRASLEMNRWSATVSPRWLEGWFAAGCRELGENIDWHQASWPTRAYLEPLVDSQTPIGPMA